VAVLRGGKARKDREGEQHLILFTRTPLLDQKSIWNRFRGHFVGRNDPGASGNPKTKSSDLIYRCYRKKYLPCSLCGVADENRDHLFLGCSFSFVVWRNICS
jgi:hypothetical protein